MPPSDAVRRFLRDMLLMGLAYGLVSKAVLTADSYGTPTGLVF